jgi:hypothetical protein
VSVEDPVLDVSGWEPIKDETLGASAKMWLREPGGDQSPQSAWVFKPVVVHADGSVQGGDWAEYLAGKTALELGAASAEIRMGQRDGQSGTLSRNVRVDDRTDCYPGSLWLDADPGVAYRATNSKSSRRSSASEGYTIGAIASSLRKVGAPPQALWGFEQLDGFDNFCTYLFLDAAIGNRDRHEQNWSVLRPILAGPPVLLAAAYDNEGSLGYNLTDARRTLILDDPVGLARFSRKGTAWRFDWDGAVAPDLVGLALGAIEMASSRARLLIRERIEGFRVEVIEAAAQLTPRMSDVARNFAINLLSTNIERLRNGLRDLDA